MLISSYQLFSYIPFDSLFFVEYYYIKLKKLVKKNKNLSYCIKLNIKKLII